MSEKLIIKNFNPCTLRKGPTSNQSSYIRLNALNSWDDDFIPIPCDNSVCNKITYLSTDPRLISASHNGDKLALDTIPRNGKVQFVSRPYPSALRRPTELNPICNEKSIDALDKYPSSRPRSGYKNVYNNYSDINGGDISYYYATDLANPFIPQLFTSNKKILTSDGPTLRAEPDRASPPGGWGPSLGRERPSGRGPSGPSSHRGAAALDHLRWRDHSRGCQAQGLKPLVIKEHYIDPMDSYKPHYCREPIYSQNCLNWIKDSQFHREDLMSKQLWNRNQNNFEVNIKNYI